MISRGLIDASASCVKKPSYRDRFDNTSTASDVVSKAIKREASRETGGLFCCVPPHNSDAYQTPSVSKSIKESIKFGCITSTDVIKATRQKPGTVRNRVNELRVLGLLTRHGKSRVT